MEETTAHLSKHKQPDGSHLPAGCSYVFFQFSAIGTPISRHSDTIPTHSQRPLARVIPGK